jgi:putative PEP-CTERM system histidine kinase
MQQFVVQISYLFCALAFAALTALAAVSKQRTQQFVWLVIASLLTVVWGLAMWANTSPSYAPSPTFVLWVELARTLAWIKFLLVITNLSQRGADAWVKSSLVLGIGIPVAIMGFVSYVELFASQPIDLSGTFFLTGFSRMVLAILGLVLLENLFRNADLDQRWATKYLCIGLGLVFAYDFFFYAEAVIFRRFDMGLLGARGFITGFAAPLIAVSVARAKYWSVDLHVSRKMAFHTAAVVGAGIYLVTISGIGFYVREFGGAAGPIIQILFLTLAAILLVTILASGSLRARAKLFIAKNFYSAKYDYREEWLRFIGTLSSGDKGVPLYQRIVSAIAPIVESTAAVLWVLDDQGETFIPVVSWNFGDDIPGLEDTDPLVIAARETAQIVETSDHNIDRLPAAILQERSVWLSVPLTHEGILRGIMILGQPRAPREFGWEDKNLLQTVAQQAASYIAEARAASALSRSHKLEEFNQRFAFVAHDMKNIVNQLSIMVQNAEQHGSNPEFQKDMIKTVSNSVSRMKDMMDTLTAHRQEAQENNLATSQTLVFDIGKSLSEVAANWSSISRGVVLEKAAEPLFTQAKEGVLVTVLNHIMQNAIDAAGPEGEIRLRAQSRANTALIDVSDNGPGMESEFVESTYFQPFKSTKPGGYGLGGFQIRQLVREMGGRLEVLTAPGQGTTIRIQLPLVSQEPSSKDAQSANEAIQ